MRAQGMIKFTAWAVLFAANWNLASAAVIRGTIDSVDKEQRTLSLKIAAKDKLQTFTLRTSAVITIGGKAATLEDLVAGQVVTITTNKNDDVTKLAASPATMSANPKSTDAPDESTDWPQFRGPHRENVSHERGLLTSWPAEGPPLAWKQTDLGLGYASVAVAKGKLYTMGNRGDDEFFLALDATTGEHLWAQRTGKAYHDGTGDGPRGTPTVVDDLVFALGANGDLLCAKAQTGDVAWRLNILQEFGAQNIQWGISESVLVDGNNVICTPGGKEATLVALNRKTGKLVWRSKVAGSPPAAYSSAIAVNVGDVRQYVNFTHTLVVGVNARDGRPLWSNSKSANPTANCSTPLFAHDAVFSASGYGTGGALVKLTSSNGNTKPKLAYHTSKMKNHHGGMVVIGDYIYGFDEDVLTCLDWEHGKVQWQDRSVGKGSLTVADGHLYLRSESGLVGLASAFPGKYEETGRYNPPDRSDKPSWSHPVVANGKLFLRDMDTLLVYNVKQ